MKSDKSCEKKRFNIIDQYKLTDADKKLIMAQNTNRATQLSNMINQIQAGTGRTKGYVKTGSCRYVGSFLSGTSCYVI